MSEKAQQQTYSSHCRLCGKLLTKPMVQIELVTLTFEQFQVFMRGVRIRYGAQSKCRHCKKLRDTLRDYNAEGTEPILAVEKKTAA